MNELFERLIARSSEDFLPIFQSFYGNIVIIASIIIAGFMIFGIIVLTAIVGNFTERKISAYIQGRSGPNRVGPFGLFQLIADSIKLLTKEDVKPTNALKFGFILSPILVFLGTFIPFVALNFSEHFVITGLDVGLYYILAFASLELIGILLAAWSSSNKWALLGGTRLATQMFACQIPMYFALLPVVLLIGSLNLNEIVNWQAQGTWIFGWTVFRSPATFIAFFIFFITGIASIKRIPFDLPRAEGELTAGFNTEYTGTKSLIFFLTEYASMFVICALTSIVFLGGWIGIIPTYSDTGRTLLDELYYFSQEEGRSYISSILAMFSSDSEGGRIIIINELIGFINLLLKTLTLFFIMIWVRWSLPRVRIDQILYLGFKVLLPISIICTVIAAIQITL